jgi:hypothetical protein
MDIKTDNPHCQKRESVIRLSSGTYSVPVISRANVEFGLNIHQTSTTTESSDISYMPISGCHFLAWKSFGSVRGK